MRKALSVGLVGWARAISQSLTHNLSLESLSWRLESLRTGKSFAEVVLLHTLLYRVEQVFLIHRETGLLLAHSTADWAEIRDADLISGMLTAIQDFVHDSFSFDQGSQLESFRVGDLTVWIEQGPLAMLAGVTRGKAPPDVRDLFRETLENIHLQFYRALDNFNGDSSPFAATSPLLNDCLRQKITTSKRQITPLMVAFVVGFCCLFAIVHLLNIFHVS
jgi:OOP family OmpA-OmpF porin